MLSYFLEKEESRDVVTGEQMLGYFLEREESRPTTGAQMLSYFLEKEESRDVVTGEQMLGYFLEREESRPTTGAQMLSYFLETEHGRRSSMTEKDVRLTGSELLEYMLELQPVPTASPTPAPTRSPVSGFDLLEYFVPEPARNTVSKKTLFVDFLSSTLEDNVSGADLLAELLTSDQVNAYNKQELEVQLDKKEAKVSGEMLLSYLQEREDEPSIRTDLLGLLELNDADIQHCVDGTAPCKAATSAQVLRAVSRSDSVVMIDKLTSYMCRNSGHSLPICSTVTDMQQGGQDGPRKNSAALPKPRAPLVSILTTAAKVKSM